MNLPERKKNAFRVAPLAPVFIYTIVISFYDLPSLGPAILIAICYALAVAYCSNFALGVPLYLGLRRLGNVGFFGSVLGSAFVGGLSIGLNAFGMPADFASHGRVGGLERDLRFGWDMWTSARLQ